MNEESDAKRLDPQMRARIADVLGNQEEPNALPSDDVVYAHLGGTATPEQQDEIRAALMSSPSFRRTMASLVRTEEAADAAFADLAVRKMLEPAPSNDGRDPSPSFFSRIRANLFWLIRQPAFAYALLVIALAYPAYQIVAPDGIRPGGPLGSAGGTVRPTKELHRGAQDSPTEIVLAADQTFIDLEVVLPEQVPDVGAIDLEITDANSTIHEFRMTTDIRELGGQRYLPLVLDVAGYPDGGLILRFRYLDPRTSNRDEFLVLLRLRRP